MQLGGVIAIRPDGKVIFHYMSEAIGDFPPDKDVLDAAAQSVLEI